MGWLIGWARRDVIRSEISLVELGEELVRIGAIAPFPAAEVETLEDVIGAPLPEEFRSFLLQFGLGVCPGPLFDLEWIIDETRREQQRFLEEPKIAVSPQEPFLSLQLTSNVSRISPQKA